MDTATKILLPMDSAQKTDVVPAAGAKEVNGFHNFELKSKYCM